MSTACAITGFRSAVRLPKRPGAAIRGHVHRDERGDQSKEPNTRSVLENDVPKLSARVTT